VTTAAIGGGVARLDAHHGQFLELLFTAERHLARGRREAAAVYAQIAGTYAWFNHTGLFASPALEDLLRRLGLHLPPVASHADPEPDPAHVLHVVTQLYQTGGPTQAIACWLEQDGDRRHTVCVTRQGAPPVPDKILSRLNVPSDLLRLDTGRGGLMGRATALRDAATRADVIILHSHPYDVIPVVAFAGVDGLPPVVFVNHADHVFWIGTTVTDVLMNMRDSGSRLAAARRGVDPRRSVVVPRPLRPTERTVAREEAKRRLGLPEDRVLIVTAADAPKYRQVSSPSFLDLLVPVLEAHDDALLFAAGPAPEGDWRVAEEATGGRIRALGRLPDVSLLQQAADVYVDSFPFSSLTSLLEAGLFGTPTLTYRGHHQECAVLGADTRGVDEHMLCPSDPEGFRATLHRLITEPSWRRDVGERTRHAIHDTHTGEGWRDAVIGLYEFAARMDVPAAAGAAERQTGQLDLLVDRVMEQTGFSEGAPGAIRQQLGLLPVGQRIAALNRLARARARFSARDVISEWLLPRLAPRWRTARELTRVRRLRLP
jgi:hypothetical protein